MRRVIERRKVDEDRRQATQGKGRPIISTELHGYRCVAVGTEMLWGRWRTFHEFLLYYLRRSFGAEWGQAEEEKPEGERHVILRWASILNERMNAATEQSGEMRSMPATGAVMALLALGYNLYLLKHNVELQRRLIGRLKKPDQFNGAYYETMVAGWCILAGCKLTLLDEVTGKSRSCEFNAKAPSGRVFSVEAKARQPGKAHTDVGNQLLDALRKDAEHDRIVFIELNTEDAPSDALAHSVSKAIRSREAHLKVGGKPAPAAYVCVTNHPFQHDLQGAANTRFMVAEGFKVPDFGTVRFTSLIEQFKAEQRHADVLAICEAFSKYEVPSTFDGELPEVAFGEVERRWLIGEQYDLERFGFAGVGVLASAFVDENDRVVHLAFHRPGGETKLFADQLSAEEITAYRRHPQSFFGATINLPGKADTPPALFKFFYNSYRTTPRTRMLEFFAAAADLHRLAELSDEELRLEYCNRHTLAAMHSGFFAATKPARAADEPPSSAGQC